MKLKPTIKGLPKEAVQETPKEPRKKQENKLPPDGYTPMFPPKRILVRETRSHKDPTKVVKQYIEVKVQRFDDDAAMPFVWISMYQESEFYTGYLKGRTNYFPLEMMYDFLELIQDIDNECEERHITCE